MNAPNLSQSFSATGQLTQSDDVVLHKINKPYDCIPNYGSLDIYFSTSIMQELSGAIVYLNDYPYECNGRLIFLKYSTVILV